MSPAYYKKAKRNRVPQMKLYNANDVWAAAAAAHRINGGYLNFAAWSEDKQNKRTNREIMISLLEDPEYREKISDQDREEGAEVRRYFQALTFKVLQGRILSPYEQSVLKISEPEELFETSFSLIAHLPNSAKNSKERDLIENRIRYEAAGTIGKLGDKITVELEVLKSIFSTNWGIYYTTGITADNNVVFFGHKSPADVGKKITVTGRVKSHRDNSTQLNRVKMQ